MLDVAVSRVLCFDRFSLDLARGCLRMGDQDLELRPKTFEVLKFLAMNAGRLVAKQELYDAVWPNVIVSDDSIAQCIRELRSRLGDDDHSLIKTVSRRGYLLDTTVTTGAPQSSIDTRTIGVAPPPPAGSTSRHGHMMSPAYGPRLWAAIATVLISVVWGATYLLGSTASLTGPQLASLPGFKDCSLCPDMIVLPTGEFMMGSPASENGHTDVEGSPRRVAVTKQIAIGKLEVTIEQISAFVAETGMNVGGSCQLITDPSRKVATWGEPSVSMLSPGFNVTPLHPAVCISWHEAQSYVAWLHRRTGKPYRLPTEAEWEYAARAGTSTRYSFGNDETSLCRYARFADLGSQFGWGDGCRSDVASYGTTPVGALKPNPWGIFDMHGNAWEWVEDCWTPNPQAMPTDGSAFSRPGSCEIGVIRGGSFAAGSRRVRSAIRSPVRTTKHFYNTGLRVALSLGG
jgi:formylglycine-generating enzyme required for sulfatase activity/DNA-binding winged helix-turn-helix (wHTH) protein